MLKLKPLDNNAKKAVEAEVIQMIEDRGYNLNAVNNYDENLLHVSAANGCCEIARKILDQESNCRFIDRKNKFGWTPLMQAIRNGDIDTVKYLLKKNANINESTYLGISVLGLAAAISKEMFETVYNACSNALANAANDDINPLCIAAMKNDKELFFKLLELGMSLSNENLASPNLYIYVKYVMRKSDNENSQTYVLSADEYTHIMMKNSTVPEIASLAKQQLIIEDYWDDTSDNIQVISERDIGEAASENESNCHVTEDRFKPILNSDKRKTGRLDKLHQLSVSAESEMQDLISPALSYNCNVFALSPSTCFFKEELTASFKNNNESTDATREDLENSTMDVKEKRQFESPPAKLRRLEAMRPPDLDITNFSSDMNVTLGFTPEFSPLKSPYVPSDINEENVFGENTPTPPRCRTPPKGMLLNSQQTEMIIVLNRFELNQHISVFLEQEVDIDLFVTLTDADLKEIGIEHKEDRRALLAAIKEYNRELENNNI